MKKLFAQADNERLQEDVSKLSREKGLVELRLKSYETEKTHLAPTLEETQWEVRNTRLHEAPGHSFSAYCKNSHTHGNKKETYLFSYGFYILVQKRINGWPFWPVSLPGIINMKKKFKSCAR